MKKILAMLLVCLLLVSALAGCDSGNSSTINNANNNQANKNNSESYAKSNTNAYDAIFDNTYIVHFQSFFNMETSHYANKNAEGIIDCHDFGYEDDVVKEWVETVYCPVSGYTDSEKTQLETQMKSEFATIEALSCCTVTYKMGTNYFTVTVTFTDLDQVAAYTELYNAGWIDMKAAISMSETEKGLLDQGFVKK